MKLMSFVPGTLDCTVRNGYAIHNSHMLLPVVPFIITLGFIIGLLLSKVAYIRFFSNIYLAKSATKHKSIHLHHSLFGAIILSALPFINLRISAELLLSSMSVGMILHHTWEERRFVFITREANYNLNSLILSTHYLLLMLPVIEKSSITVTVTSKKMDRLKKQRHRKL